MRTEVVEGVGIVFSAALVRYTFHFTVGTPEKGVIGTGRSVTVKWNESS